MRGVMIIRAFLLVVGTLEIVGALAIFAVGGIQGLIGSIWLLIMGAILIAVAVLEITRYRSEAAERAKAAPGPGGGETTPLEARFMRTDEVFIDPTSQRRMRVFADLRTGERRYVAEG